MPEYNIGFSEKLIEAAQVVSNNGKNAIDAQRTVLYLSLLSCEIALKAFLENAGVPIQEIAHYSHKLRSLLDAVCHCEIQEEIVAGQSMWVSASRVCAITVAIESGTSTICTLLTLEQEGASRYPNEIRYGEAIAHAPANAMLQAAEKIFEWVTRHLGRIRRKEKTEQSQYDTAANGNFRRRDTHTAAINFCSAYGGGITTGAELKFTESERGERGQDYWIGYELVDPKGKKCGEVIAGYVAYIADIRLYAAITLDGEVVESEANALERISSHKKEKNEQPKELKALLIKISERATRKAKTRRGIHIDE
jgi:HEPN domain-containing protein